MRCAVLFAIALIAFALSSVSAAASLSFTDAHQRGAPADVADLDVALAEQRVLLLERQLRPHLELRPQTLLFAVWNPAAAGASILSEAFLGSGGGAGRFALENARFDVMDAKLRRERTRFQLELELSKIYFNAARQQQIAARTCQGLEHIAGAAKAVDQRVQAGAATALDRARLEEQLLDWESDCERTTAQFHEAMAELGARIPSGAEQLEIAEPSEDVRPLRAPEALAAMVLEQRAGMRDISGALEHFRSRRLAAHTGSRLLSTDYSRILSSRVVIGKGSENAAEDNYLSLRAQQINAQLTQLRNDIDTAVRRLSALYDSAAKRLQLADRKRQTIAHEREVLELRVRAGLDDPQALLAVEYAAALADIRQTEAAADLAHSSLTVAALCGVTGQTSAQLSRIFAHAPLRADARGADDR